MMTERSPEPSPRAPALMHRIEVLISWLLFGGVTLSMATVLVGLVLIFLHHPEYLRSGKELERLTSPGAAFPHTLNDVAQGVAAGRGQALVVLGLLLLIATPILRVAVSMVGFALEQDRAYLLISAFVLTVLLVSFLLGKAG